jgi:hypothetical protein
MIRLGWYGEEVKGKSFFGSARLSPVNIFKHLVVFEPSAHKINCTRHSSILPSGPGPQTSLQTYQPK